MRCNQCAKEKIEGAIDPCLCIPVLPEGIPGLFLLKEPRQKRRDGDNVFRQPVLKELDANVHFHDLWDAFHNMDEPSMVKLLAYAETLPRFCGCTEHFLALIERLPPRFDDWSRWTWEIHNEVNAMLSKPMFTWCDYVGKYRPDLWPSQPQIDNLLLVTSLSPLPSHAEQQAIALESWKRFGLDVVSVNLPGEIRTLKKKYDVEFIGTTESCEQFNRKTPTINSIVDVSVARDTPIMILNSDCALYGSQRLVLDVPQVGIGIRHNWSEHLSDATQEQWGLDAFVLRPEHARSLPRLPFGIGQPMWDYWMAWHMQQAGFQVDWIGSKLIYHKSHPTNWTPEDCQAGRNWITEHYKKSIDWVQWREQQPHTFSLFSPVGK